MGRYHEVVGDDVATSLIAFAKGENATQLVLGATRRSRLQELMGGSPVARVVRKAGDIDIHVISYEGARPRRARRTTISSSPEPCPANLGMGHRHPGSAADHLGAPHRGSTPRFTTSFSSISWRRSAPVSSVAPFPPRSPPISGFFLANWYFTPPVRSWTINSADNLFSLFAFLFVSLVVGLLVGLSSRRAAEARRARAQAEALAATAAGGHPVFGTDERGLVRRIRETFGLEAASVLRREGDSWVTLAWDGDIVLDRPDKGSEIIDLTGGAVLVILDGQLTTDDRAVLRAFAAQIVQALEREELEREAGSAEAMAETDRLRTALLGAVSHDLRTPLATIKASVTSLLETGVEWTPDQTSAFLRAILEETERLDRLVGRLLDASRVQVGAVHVFFRPVGLDEVVAAALGGLGAARERVVVDIPESLPEVQTDPALLERAVANLIENALIWSPEHRIGESQRRGDCPPHRPPDHRSWARHPSGLARRGLPAVPTARRLAEE